MNNRITDHPILGRLTEQDEIIIYFNGRKYTALSGDTIASALMANGIRTLRQHEASNTPRGIYCNIGHCYECRVEIDGDTDVRACLTPVKDNMIIKSLSQVASPLDATNLSSPKNYREYLALERSKTDDK